eukprot:1155541-Amphidinium_carterae.1
MFLEFLRTLSGFIGGGSVLGGTVVRCVLEDTLIGHSGVRIAIFACGFVSGVLSLLLFLFVQGQRKTSGFIERVGVIEEGYEARTHRGGALPRRR